MFGYYDVTLLLSVAVSCGAKKKPGLFTSSEYNRYLNNT